MHKIRSGSSVASVTVTYNPDPNTLQRQLDQVSPQVSRVFLIDNGSSNVEEIYRIVEQFQEVSESIVVGQEWDGDVRIVLFIRLQTGFQLDKKLMQRIRDAMRQQASPRHVPAKILEVPDIPRTRSGKIVEIAVQHVVHDRRVPNTDALENPDASQVMLWYPGN